MNRRDLLKYFGIGTIITPVVDGAPIVGHAAELVTVPNLKPALVNEFPDGHIPSYFQDRLKWNPYEAIWLRMWQIENNSSWQTGPGPLAHLLQREPTEHEKAIAAAIIQWFGTNCGHSLVTEILNTCGYAVTHNRNLPSALEIARLQNHNVFHGGDMPKEIRIPWRGRNIVLRAGTPGYVE